VVIAEPAAHFINLFAAQAELANTATGIRRLRSAGVSSSVRSNVMALPATGGAFPSILCPRL
jgi:hypothetical protein